MATKRDYYEILGIAKNASESEIKRSYRDLARKYHPDVYKGADAQTKFKEINEAYQVLSDPKKKAAYDQFGHGAFETTRAGPAWSGWSGVPGVEVNFDFGDFRDPFDIFEEFFGTRTPFGFDFGSRSSSQRRPVGEDIHYELTIPFEEAVFGTERSVNLERKVVCPECRGSGVEKGSRKIACDRCRGQGVVPRMQRTIFGNMQTYATCDKCKGEGSVPEKVCSSCRGKTVIGEDKLKQIKIPSGVDDGSVIRYQGLGNVAEKNGESGDLYLTIRVLTSKKFSRVGFDIYYDLPLKMTQAALGEEIKIPTLEGEEKLKIRPGTQPGTEVRLKNKGIPYLNGRGRGDLIVRISVEIHRHLSRKQEELLKEFNRS